MDCAISGNQYNFHSIVCWSVPSKRAFFRHFRSRYRIMQCLKYDSGHANNLVSCSTFNILAPIYKRINGEDTRESEFREKWISRNETILDLLLLQRSSIICLQEFWVQNQEFIKMYEKHFHEAGYEIFMLQRTNNRGDGLLTAIRNDHFKVLHHRQLYFNDFGDRAAQLLHLKSVPTIKGDIGRDTFEVIVVNTHLLFPHNSSYCLVRLRQVYRILEYLNQYKAEHNVTSIPVILCGDWNGSKRGHVYKFLRSQGFISSYDTANNYTDSEFDARKWISHRNHRGNICGVDFIWLLNPGKARRPLRDSWMEAVFGLIKSKLKEAGLNESDAFYFFQPDNKISNYVTLKDFRKGLKQLGLTEQLIEGLTNAEIQDLMFVADLDGNGVIDNQEFQKMMIAHLFKGSNSSEGRQRTSVSMNPESFPKKTHYSSLSFEHENPLFLSQKITSNTEESLYPTDEEQDLQNIYFTQKPEIVFDVKEASLFPPEAGRGIWPEDYGISDHALLSVVLSPRSRQGTERAPHGRVCKTNTFSQAI
eukprot:TRINITY_DN2902_c0_g1_i7.p1 TRINITY_DN2902_c0_g1~~TRINITY_DN2902_c0_g1_i7.p1  ORF type:complete len:533 (+),score=77.80 TRINITY_DN2902_c0_g1_i7:203-1801(+)